ncbi:hypothetical protein C8R43DRAFT_1195502 [Mycena crocata]|nr:hypothetical protein C8R43DRAFT_1195502 [Mycena crocata]
MPPETQRNTAFVKLRRLGSTSSDPRTEKSRRFLEILAAEACTFIPFVTGLILDGRVVESSELPHVFATLSKLTAVTSLEFNGWQLHKNAAIPQVLAWLPRLTRLSVLTLTRVSSEHTRQVFSVLECGSSLASVNITSSTWASEYDWEGEVAMHKDVFAFFQNTKPPRETPVIPYSRADSIENLELDCPKMDLLDVFGTKAPSLRCSRVNLKNIHVDETKSIGTFLRLLGNTLEHLRLHFWSSAEKEFCDNVDLCHNTGLRSLHINNIIEKRPFIPEPDLLMKLPSILRGCASPHLIDITFYMYFAAVVYLEKFDWAMLDECLASMELNPSLIVTFCVADLSLDHDRTELADFLGHIRTFLPRACSQVNIAVRPGGELRRPLTLGGEIPEI